MFVKKKMDGWFRLLKKKFRLGVIDLKCVIYIKFVKIKFVFC